MVEVEKTKVRVDIDVIIHKVQLKVKEPTQFTVEFMRNGKSTRPKDNATASPDDKNNEVRLGKSMKFTLPKTSIYQLSDGSYEENEFTLTLIVGDQIIGVVRYDLTKQMGKARAGFRAIMSDDANEARESTDVNLVGNKADYPGTRLEFHVKVSETPADRRRPSQL